MPKFGYLAKRSPTQIVEGIMEAETRRSVVGQLLDLGYTPVRVLEVLGEKTVVLSGPAPVREPKVPRRHLNQFTRQFASLVRSQVPILRILQILKEQTAHAALRRLVGVVQEEIRQGQTLSSALERHPRVFSGLYVSLIRSGEAGGMLDAVLDRLAEQADREEDLQAKIQASLAYPLFVGAVGFLTVLFLLIFVIPRLVKLFGVFGSALPLPTRLLLGLMGSFSQGGFLYLGVGLALIGLVFLAARTPKGRCRLDAARLRFPVIGPLIRQVEMTRFSRSFGLLLEHGVPVLQATEVALPVVRDRILREELARLSNHLRDGNTLSTGLQGLSIASPFLIHTVAVAEETGKLGEAFTEVAHCYEGEIERGLRLLTALLEPATILLVGGAVGFIVLAVLLPILTLGTITR